MAEGNDTYRGLAVPLYGNFEIIGISTTEDIMTLTAAGGATGDFIVCQTSAGTEAFVVEDDGATKITAGGLTVTAGDTTVTAGDVIITSGYYLRFGGTIPTTNPTTGITIGDIWVQKTSSELQLCVASNNLAVRYVNTTSA